jgi:chromosome segregation ATPase
VGRSSASTPTRGRPHQPTSSSSDAHAAHHTPPYRKATPGELDYPTSQQITRERSRNLSDLPSRSTGASGRPRRVPEEGESSNEHHAKFVARGAPSGKEIALLEHGRPLELERQLSETLVEKIERERRIGQLTDELALKDALLAQAAEEKRRAGQTLRKLQKELDRSLSRDHALEQAEANAAEEKGRAGLEQRELQAKLDELVLSRDQALEEAQNSLQKATSRAAEVHKRNRLLEELEAMLEARASELAKLGELLLSRDQALEQTQSSLQEATFRAAEANEQNQRELAEVHVKLEARESELAAVRLRLTDAEDGLAKSKAEADTLRAQTAAGPVNTDVDRVMHSFMERMRAMETEISSLRGNEKSREDMECRNEG